MRFLGDRWPSRQCEITNSAESNSEKFLAVHQSRVRYLGLRDMLRERVLEAIKTCPARVLCNGSIDIEGQGKRGQAFVSGDGGIFPGANAIDEGLDLKHQGFAWLHGWS